MRVSPKLEGERIVVINSGKSFFMITCDLFAILVPLWRQGFFYFYNERIKKMETRVAIIGIIVESKDSIENLNAILHEYSKYIVGRMGIPYEKRGINIISVVIDAPNNVISALSGKLGMLPDVNIKTVYSKVSIGE